MDILVLLLSQMSFSSENMVTGKGQKRVALPTPIMLLAAFVHNPE